MTRTYQVNVECADCAAKIERAIREVDGVQKARLNFMTQKLKVTADDDRFERVMDEAQRVGNRIEREFAIAR